MPLFLLVLGRWLLSKTFLYIAAGALAVGLLAFFLFAKESVDSERERVTELLQIEERAGQVYGELNAIHDRLVELGSEIEASHQRIQAAQRVVATLDGLLKRFERFMTMSPAEKAATERDLAKAQAEIEEENALIDRLFSEQSRLRLDRASFTIEAKSLEKKLAGLEADSSQFVEYIENAWRQLKPYLIVAIASVILLPIVLKLFAFYVWAPFLGFSGPMRFSEETLSKPFLREKGVSAQVTVEKGQRLWVRESFLQASDESLSRKTRFVLDWSIPATCLAAGLLEMVEFSGETERGGVTISPQKRAELEVATVEIPKGGEMIVRPSSIAGLLSRNGETITIKRRWRIFHPQAWLTLQFRYFVFRGPCSLIVSGVRGVRLETLDAQGQSGRRSNQIATIGFTPDLSYGVVRAETFWSYFRGYNPLFDDVFRGRGAFLCQEIVEENATSASRFWSGLWSGILKVLGV